MKTLTMPLSGKHLNQLWRNRSANLKVDKTMRFILFLLGSIFLSGISYAQTSNLKKGYSKHDITLSEKQMQEKLKFNQNKYLYINEVEGEKCGFTAVEQALQNAYPNRGTDSQFEKWMQEKIARGEYDASRSVTTIPVVVHVIHNGETVGVGPNISEEQVLSQMIILNEDFRRLNADAANTPEDFVGVAADSELEFCLATVDPQGNPTDGIHRFDGGLDLYSITDMENVIKVVTSWNPDYYFNIWVCPLQDYLGYAQFPSASGLDGMPIDGGPARMDGIVCTHSGFGNTGTASYPFDLGRTATHEAGHFFGLRHIWGDGGCTVDDYVDDTPLHAIFNFTGAPCTYPGPNSCFEPENDLPDQFMNYMDYSDDGCMNMFTQGQKARFEVVISNSPRRNYENSYVCQGIAPGAENDFCEDAITLQCGDVVTGNTEYASNTGAVTDCSDNPFSDDPGIGVWYNIEGTGGDITLSTCNAANYDTRIDVYTGSCGDLTCYAGNDDALGCSGFTSELTFASETSVTYYVYVSGWGSGVGNFNLTVDCACEADAGECATVYMGYEPAECTDLTASGMYGAAPYTYAWSTGETTMTITVCPISTTTYTVTVTDADGCVSTDEVTVDVIDVRCGNNFNKVEICHIPPDDPDNPQTLCISTRAVANHLAHGDHLGACGIEPCDGFYSGGAGQRQIVTGTLIVSDDDWIIYPNPAYDRVSIDLSVLYGHKTQITVFDASGRVFWKHPSQILESAVIELDLNKVPSGIYHIVLQTNNQSMVKKLVITK